MEGFENNQNQEYDIKVVDFPFICRICLKRSDSRLFKVEDYLLNLYLTITKIKVPSTASLPDNICNNCIKTLEDISLFIDNSMHNLKSGKNFIPMDINEHLETTKCEMSQKHVIDSEEYEEDLQYFKGFEICRICYSTNILKPVEEKAHLMQLFQEITNTDVKAEVVFCNRNSICSKCIKELEIISLFINVSLCNEMKLKNTIGRNEALQNENCSEGNAIVDYGIRNEMKIDDEFDKKIAHTYDTKSLLHTSIDIKEEIIETPEVSTEQISQNGIKNFSKSHSEENSFDCGPCKDEFGTGTNLKNLLKGLDNNLVIQSGTNHLKCEGSDETFTQKHTSKSYLFTHVGKKPFKCNCCEKSFFQKVHLQMHMLIHTGRKLFKCDCCEKTFSFEHILKSHLLTHNEGKPFECYCCGTSFSKKRSLQRHMLIHTGENLFKCDCCEKRFSQKTNLQRHMLIHTGEKSFKCECCKKRFSQKGNLQQHMLIHSGEKSFQCDCCEKTFAVKKSLKSHLLTHTGEKPFKCECCEKSFASKQVLQRHLLIHTGEKTFKCECCEKSFAFKQVLQRHLLIHTGEKTFKCHCCEKNFSQKSNLDQHMLIHTGKRPFKCDCCEKSFSRKSNLQQHLLLHTGERPFKCVCCEKSFSQKSNLQQHMLIHTGKRFQCDCCEKSYIQKAHLQRHMLIHTGEKSF